MTVDGAAGEITATGIVDEARLFHRKLRLISRVTLRAGEPKLYVTDEVQNLSSEATDFQLLYHINFGMPFVQPGAQLVAPAAEIAPARSAFQHRRRPLRLVQPGRAWIG